MERAEAHLSPDDIVRLNALSADLSMIHDREIPDPEVAARVPPQDVPRLTESAYKSGKWEDVLELLRVGVAYPWRADQIAYVRSCAYEGLGEQITGGTLERAATRRARSVVTNRRASLRCHVKLSGRSACRYS